MPKQEPIDFGLYLNGWKYEDGDIGELRRGGRRITALDYEQRMRHHIFCAYCGTNITRRPLEANISRDGKAAYFAHIPKYRGVECDRRTKYTPGYNFENEEEAREAIQRGDLVIVSGFATAQQLQQGTAGPYAGGPVEDPHGPTTDVFIGRHEGATFLVPGRQRTVAGICRDLDVNLQKYYILPGMRSPQVLSELLHFSGNVQGLVAIEKLYYGKIKEVDPRVRQTTVWLSHHATLKDFAVTAPLPEVRAKGIHQDSVGQYVLFWGPVVEYGISFAVRGVSWGEYALVSPQYTALLDDLARAN